MSASITSATWLAAASGPSGSWTDPTHWSTAAVPGAATNALIGPGITATAPWTVTVAGAQAADNLTVQMGSQGTLSISGALDVAGAAALGYGSTAAIGSVPAAPSIAGAVVDVGAGATFGVAGNLIALGSAFNVNGGTITTGGFADLDAAPAVVGTGGVWNAASLWIGEFFTSSMSVGGAGLVDVARTLDLGFDGTKAAPLVEGIGTLNLVAGGELIAPLVNVVNGSTLGVDSLSSLALGGPAIAGAVAIGAAGTLALETARVAANVVDDGTLTALVNANAASAGIGPVVTGGLSGSGLAHVGTGYTLEVGSAAAFAGSLQLDPGATLRIDAGAVPTGAVSMLGGTIDLRALAFSGQPLAYSGTMLSVGGESIDVGAGFVAGDFAATADAAGGTAVANVACYVAGTRLAVEHGEAAVESLHAGDVVRTAGGRLAPVRWVGRLALDLRRHPAPRHAAPVRIVAGTFAPGLPRRDLLVSPDHALLVGDALMPARKLVNGATIRQDAPADAVTYVHVELDRHDLLLAEGLAAESFLDTGNRDQFAADADPAPCFDRDPEAAALRVFAERGCAPLMLRGDQVEAAQARLRERAEALGWRLESDPGLTIATDRGPVIVRAEGAELLQVLLPPGARRVELRSRSFIPELLDPACGDGRRLGAALGVELDGGWLEPAGFADGWWPAEDGESWRWTDGAGTLMLPGRSRRGVLTLHLVAAGARYWVGPAPAVAAEAA